MSMMARLNANLEAAIAEQWARHAAEEGRDRAREQCVEAMLSAYPTDKMASQEQRAENVR
jgi:hypothetical protein